MPFELKKLGTLERGEAETLLLTGPAGSGKTFFCGTAGARTFFVNVGHGITTLQSPLFRKLHPTADEMLTVTLHEEVDKFGLFKKASLYDDICDVIDQAIATVGDQFDTIVVDDASATRRGAMNKALEINQRTGKSQSQSRGEVLGLMTPAMQDYQTEMELMEKFVAGTTQLAKHHKKHLIVTGHQRYSYKKGEKMGDPPILMKVSPAFTGVDKNPDQIAQYFDNVWVTEAVGGGSTRLYRIITQGHEQLTAKTRWAGVFDVTEKDLTWLKALERIRNSDPQKKLVGVRTT